MINTSRQIDTILFTLDQDVIFCDTSILKGMNQIRRKDNIYNVYRVDDLNNPYAFIYLDEMPSLLHVVYAKLINVGAFEELEEKKVLHTHVKKTDFLDNVYCEDTTNVIKINKKFKK